MMNNFLNKNSLIGALIILLLVTSWWGQSESGSNRQLTQNKEAAEAQLATVEAEAATTRQALQEKTAALADGEKALSEAQATTQRLAKNLSIKNAALTTLNKEEKVLLQKINELERSLKKTRNQQKQVGSQQQKNLLKIAHEHQKTLVELEKSQAQAALLANDQAELKNLAEARIAQLQQKQHKLKTQTEGRMVQLRKKQHKLKTQTEARIAQLRKKQAEVATEAESLQAQVIGFEKVVEERNATLAEIDSDLQACKVNTKVLLSKITEQENAQQGMKEKMHLMVQDLSEEAAHKNTAPVQNK